MLALGGRGMPENAGIAANLWQDSSSATAAALHSPFVKGLADGSLPKYAVTQRCLTYAPITSSELPATHPQLCLSHKFQHECAGRHSNIILRKMHSFLRHLHKHMLWQQRRPKTVKRGTPCRHCLLELSRNSNFIMAMLKCGFLADTVLTFSCGTASTTP